MAALLENVGVNHRCGNITVAQKRLDRPNVTSALQQMGGETVPERMGADPFI